MKTILITFRVEQVECVEYSFGISFLKDGANTYIGIRIGTSFYGIGRRVR